MIIIIIIIAPLHANKSEKAVILLASPARLFSMLIVNVKCDSLVSVIFTPLASLILEKVILLIEDPLPCYVISLRMIRGQHFSSVKNSIGIINHLSSML